MSRIRKYLPYIFLLLAVAFCISDLLQKVSYSPDDTYIYLMYAKNLAAGGGFSFNCGEPSYGITSLLWSVIISSGSLFFSDAYWFAKIMDLLFAILSAVMFYKLSLLVFSETFEDSSKSRGTALLSVSIFLLNSWFIRWTFTGMETDLALFLIISFFYLLFRFKFYSAYVLLGLLFLVRPECIILALITTIYLFIKRTEVKRIATSIFIYAAIIVSALIYSKLTFGTIFPNTTIGKATFSQNLGVRIDLLIRILGTIAYSSAIDILLALAFFAFLRRYRVNDSYWVMIFWIGALIMLYVIPHANIISRYLLIIMPFITIIGISVIGFVKKRYILISVVVFTIVLFQSQFVFYRYVKPHTDNFSYGVENCFKEIGRWLDQNTPKESRILVNDVGVIGLYSNRYIIDAAALVNRDLDLNRKIMTVPIEERGVTANLLKFINADYLIERDSLRESRINEIGQYRLEYLFEKEFPSLGIVDPSPKYYKVYKLYRNP